MFLGPSFPGILLSFHALHPAADVLQSACWWSGKGLQLEYPEVAMHIPIVWLTYRLCPTSGDALNLFVVCIIYIGFHMH